jgi:cytochrome c
MSILRSFPVLARLVVFLLFTSAAFVSCSENPRLPAVLVFSKTKGWKHSSIPSGQAAMLKLGRENGFAVDTTRSSEVFTDSDLRKYRAVIFLNTTGNVLNPGQQAAFERFIQAGGGFVGIHSAADTEYEWPWYGRLMGAHFASHPLRPGIRRAVVDVIDSTHDASKALPARWERSDEWYNYRSFYPGIKVLANLDETSYEGGTNGSNHPIAWYHEFDGGRAFYTGGGHVDSSFSEPLFLRHLLGGIKYAMGSRPLDYSKAYSRAAPEENRFVKTILANDLDTPMELAVSDDGRIFFTELRTANLYMHNTSTGKNSLVHRFDVCTTGGAGLIGVTLDPDFLSSNYLYVYYSPATDKEPIIFNLSRFTVKADNTLDPGSEKILLQVPVQKNSGAHHGGSLAWDKDGNLYLSTGDSSSPFPANGYAPLDERPGAEFFSLDAQRSSSNTNDLKGKVLRIHPEEDGTYTIPEGNLFPKGTTGTLPEVYVMGCRNPYRIAVNPKTSTLYWGEIGPDAGKDSVQGPRGYDEFNQAKAPGNYGWPYFVGNNAPYVKWDFATHTPGPLFKPEAPENTSPNNTGLTILPEVVPAMIYYPYAFSEEFPELGQGGRSAMAGAFYVYDKKSTSPHRFPEYYGGKLFVFDWMRNWVMALRFNEEENYAGSEPFMPVSGDFRRPIDLAFGKDGVMYMLEYGSVYGADNPDARLVRIEYNTGNRPPVARAGISDPTAEEWNSNVFLTSERSTASLKESAGPAPMEVSFTSRGSKDLDEDDVLKFEWVLEGKTSRSAEANPRHTFKRVGTYHVILRVTDSHGASSTDTVVVKAGNTRPDVRIVTTDNKSFFWNNKPFRYSVEVADKEDAGAESAEVSLFMDYNPDPGTGAHVGAAATAKLVQTSEPLSPGYAKIMGSDCKACHTVNEKSVGPSYTDIYRRYKGSENALAVLTKKVIEGGGGNWGTEHVMSAHPQLDYQDAAEMVKYILEFGDPKNQRQRLAPAGSVKLRQHGENEPRGVYTLTATYTDKGANGVGALSDSEVVKLRPAKLRPIDADLYVGISRWRESFGSARNKSYVMLNNVDLTGIRKITYEYGSKNRSGEFEVRLESLAGPVIARTAFKPTGSWDKKERISEQIPPVSGRHHLYLIFVSRDKSAEDLVKLWSFEFGQ